MLAQQLCTWCHRRVNGSLSFWGKKTFPSPPPPGHRGPDDVWSECREREHSQLSQGRQGTLSREVTKLETSLVALSGTCTTLCDVYHAFPPLSSLCSQPGPHLELTAGFAPGPLLLCKACVLWTGSVYSNSSSRPPCPKGPLCPCYQSPLPPQYFSAQNYL